MRKYSKNKFFIFFTQNYTFRAFFCFNWLLFYKNLDQNMKKTHFAYSCLENFLPAKSLYYVIYNFVRLKILYKPIESVFGKSSNFTNFFDIDRCCICICTNNNNVNVKNMKN